MNPSSTSKLKHHFLSLNSPFHSLSLSHQTFSLSPKPNPPLSKLSFSKSNCWGRGGRSKGSGGGVLGGGVMTWVLQEMEDEFALNATIDMDISSDEDKCNEKEVNEHILDEDEIYQEPRVGMDFSFQKEIGTQIWRGDSIQLWRGGYDMGYLNFIGNLSQGVRNVVHPNMDQQP